MVTRLDHDANVTPWVLAAQDRGVNVRWVDFDVEDGTLYLDDFAAAMELHPRLVAVGYASNALGTINPVKKLVQMAHAAGAQVYIDAVQYAAHGPIDVQNLGCDFLVTSAYKCDITPTVRFSTEELGDRLTIHYLFICTSIRKLAPLPFLKRNIETGQDLAAAICYTCRDRSVENLLSLAAGKDQARAPHDSQVMGNGWLCQS